MYDYIFAVIKKKFAMNVDGIFNFISGNLNKI